MGPSWGKPRHVGCLAIGADVVATAVTCARIMGLNPEKIPYLSVAARYHGQIDASRIFHSTTSHPCKRLTTTQSTIFATWRGEPVGQSQASEIFCAVQFSAGYVCLGL